MIKILLIIQAFIALAVAGVILYAYIQAKREAEKVAVQQADLEAWPEHTADGTNETWQRVSAPSRPVGQDVSVFAGEYNRPIPQGGAEGSLAVIWCQSRKFFSNCQEPTT